MGAPLALLVIGKDPLPEEVAENQAFQAWTAETPDKASQEEKRPDIVVLVPDLNNTAAIKETISSWLDRACLDRFRFPPGVFCGVPALLGAAERLEVLEAGCDRVIDLPLSSREILVKARMLREKHLLAQQQHTDSQALKKSFAYLDRFKSELATAKTDLVEEKTSLNAALKQIQEMTGERSRLKKGLAETKESLQDNMEGFGRILSTLIQTRVEKNRGHAQRVSEIAKGLGREMGLDENRLEVLSKAGMLHETGLLFMSEAYLADKEQREPGQMSAYDSTMMLKYPVKGADLLEHCPGFEAAARVIRSLNEWADGTGYPDGLKRRHIPLESKILAGADELEGLKERPDIEGPEALLAALEEMAGTRLDPVVVGHLSRYVVTRMTPDAFKVRGVGVEQLVPGMTLGAALFTSSGTKLFSAGTELTREFIDKIIQYSREYPVDEIVYIKV